MTRIWLLLLTIMLGACAALPPGHEDDLSTVPPGAVSAQPAVIQLASRADSAVEAGDFERGASALERALRIEPGNAELWHRLARLRYEQGQFDQAIHLASKSNLLTQPTSPQLRRRNLLLIADAYEANGDRPRAAKVRAQLEDRGR